MATIDYRKKLLEAQAKNLREFGYPSAKPEQVMEVYVFRGFFKSALEETLDDYGARDKRLAEVIKELLAEIEVKNAAGEGIGSA